jgi:hypothetical protein
MQFNQIPWWLWLIPIALLFIAIEKMPYGYYTLTRIVVCGFASFLVFVGWKVSRIWSVILGCIAVLFNPIIPIFLSRSTWYDFDVGVAIIFGAHLAFMRLGWLRTKGS